MRSSLKFSGCALCSIPHEFFQKLTNEENKLLRANSTIINYKRNEVLCKQGSIVDQIMYLEKGLAKVFIEDEDSSLLLRIVTNNNFIGLEAIADQQQTFPYSAISYVDCKIRQIDKKIISELLLRNAILAKEIIEIVSTSSINLYGRYFSLSNKHADRKLADIILCLADRVFNDIDFELPFSRKDFAELSGMRIETLSRMLQKFVKEGLIILEGKRIKILDFDKLQDISTVKNKLLD